jgi:hypothetical protein
MFWRIWLLAGLALALLLGSASLWAGDNPPTRTCLSSPPGNTLFSWDGTAKRISCQDTAVAQQREDYLRYAGFAVAVLTLASLPLLRRPRHTETPVT